MRRNLRLSLFTFLLLGLSGKAKSDEAKIFLDIKPKANFNIEKLNLKLKVSPDTLSHALWLYKVLAFEEYRAEVPEHVITFEAPLDTTIVIETGTYLIKTDEEHEIYPDKIVVEFKDLLLLKGEWWVKDILEFYTQYRPIVNRSGKVTIDERCEDLLERIVRIEFESEETKKTDIATVEFGNYYKIEELRGSETYKLYFIIKDDSGNEKWAQFEMPQIKLNREKNATLNFKLDLGERPIGTNLSINVPPNTKIVKAYLVRKPKEEESISSISYKESLIRINLPQRPKEGMYLPSDTMRYIILVEETSQLKAGAYVLDVAVVDENNTPRGIYSKDLSLPAVANVGGSVKENNFEIELGKENLVTKSLAEIIETTVQEKITSFSYGISRKEKKDSLMIPIGIEENKELKVYNLEFYIKQNKKGWFLCCGAEKEKIEKVIEFSYKEIERKMKESRANRYMADVDNFVANSPLKVEISYVFSESSHDLPPGWKGENPCVNTLDFSIYKIGSSISPEDFKKIVKGIRII